MKNLNHNRNSKIRSNEITSNITDCQKCKATRKIDRKDGKQKEGCEYNNTNQGYFYTKSDFSREKLSLINSKIKDKKMEAKEGLENVSEVNLPLNVTFLFKLETKRRST